MQRQIKPFKRVLPKGAQVSTSEFSDAQIRLEQSINDVTTTKIINGLQLDDLSLDPTYVNLIEHGLGRKWIGYLITEQDEMCLTRVNDSGVDNALYLPLEVSTSATVSLWVY